MVMMKDDRIVNDTFLFIRYYNKRVTYEIFNLGPGVSLTLVAIISFTS